MTWTDPQPRLRSLEAFPIDHEGQSAICIRDPLGHAGGAIAVPPELFFILTCLDGQRTIVDVQQAFAAKYGSPLANEELEKILVQLDEGLFLDSDRFRRHLDDAVAAYRAAPSRSAAHAGAAYPEDETECRKMLDAMFAHPEGPATTAAPRTPAGPLRGMIAPHIDLRVGGVCSAHAYHALAAAPVQPDLIVVLGTSHHPMRRRFGLTRKDFETPFGRVEIDTAVADRLEQRFGESLYEDELNHRGEHSIEFQALFLGYLYEQETRPKMLPVLVGSLHEFVDLDADPRGDAEFADFLTELRASVESLGRRVVYVAGVDLAHVGQRFGAETAPTKEDLARIERADRESLALLEQSDGSGFFRYIAAEKDARNVCGTAPITAMMELLDADQASLLRYEQAYEDETGSVVTFASMAFHAPPASWPRAERELTAS